VHSGTAVPTKLLLFYLQASAATPHQQSMQASLSAISEFVVAKRPHSVSHTSGDFKVHIYFEDNVPALGAIDEPWLCLPPNSFISEVFPQSF
jgi:hypothetical protein